MQQETWRREDTAVQRRMADLKAAGLSPILAAGSAASTSAPIHLETPQVSGDAVGTAMQTMRMRQDIATSKAQEDLLNMQYANADASGFVDRMVKDVLRKDASSEGLLSYNLINNQIKSKIADSIANQRTAEEVVRNTDLAREYGVASNSSGAMDAINSIRLINQAPGKPGISPAWAGILQILKSLK